MNTEKFQPEIDAFLNSVSVETVGKLADNVFRNSLEDLIRQTGADAGAVWIADEKTPDSLTIAVNVGDKGESIEGNVSQQLESGLVSRAFKEDVFVHDQGVFRSPEQSMEVDLQLGQLTTHQMACPFKMFGKTVGALTVIQLTSLKGKPRREWGFDEAAVNAFQCWAPVAEKLAEYSVVRMS
jgi:hypothetical protein